MSTFFHAQFFQLYLRGNCVFFCSVVGYFGVLGCLGCVLFFICLLVSEAFGLFVGSFFLCLYTFCVQQYMALLRNK